MPANKNQAMPLKVLLYRMFVAFCICLLSSACHRRGGEPSAADIADVYRTELERINAAGTNTLTFTPTGKTLQVESKLDKLEKISCTGRDFVYVCEVKAWMRYPLQEIEETHKLKLTVFDGPKGWQFVEGELLERLEWSK